MTMLKNYFVIAFRNLYRNSFYSAINVAGLAIGLACSILILLWVADELSFDRFHKNYSTNYKAWSTQEYSGSLSTINTTPYPLMDAIKNTSPQVKRVAMTNHGEGGVLAFGDTKLTKMGLAVTEDFLKMFTFQMLQGDPVKALADPSSIVLTESTAKALFADKDPMNQVVNYDKVHQFKVAAVMKDIPGASTFQFDFLMPFSYYESYNEWVKEAREQWQNDSFHIYVELESSDYADAANAAIRDLIRKNEPLSPTAKIFLYPMSRWRLYSNFENGVETGGLIQYVRLFSAIAVFILAIACINFMNLATARSEKRAREVGIRKSVGSMRKQLVTQFLGESILIAFIGFLLSMMVVELALPSYNVLVGKQLSIDYTNPVLWICALGIVLLTGIVSGSYPAFYLSSFQPVTVLKGLVGGGGGSTPRKVLVTLQFGFSIFLIIGTLIIYQQIMHVKNREIGYDKENLLLIWSNSEIEERFVTIKEELKRTGVVKAVCKSSAPVTRIFSSADVEWEGKDPTTKVGVITVATEYDYAETMGVKLLAGRDFSPEFPSDSSAVVINKAAADMMGFKEPVGSRLRMWGDEWTVIGVTENIVMGNPYAPVDPLVMAFIPSWSSTINVRLEKTNDIAGALAKVEETFKKFNPSFPISYRFADAEFETKFSSINLIGRLANLFSSLAIVITCLGLFGLAAFTAEQRKKELGIRKVMGATVSGLILLLSKDFSRLILIAFVISAPLAWWALNSFLEQYPYRINIAWWVLPAAGLVSLILAMLIVGTQAFRAAQSNPVDSLRSE